MRNRILLFFLVGLLMGCDQEFELQKSIFKNDPEFPGLPIYSEWGFNTFGAYYDRAPFTSRSRSVPAKFIVTSGMGSFILEGERTEDFHTPVNIGLKFMLPNITPEFYEGLVQLHNITFDLTAGDAELLVIQNGVELAASAIEGQLMFTRAQFLKVDGKPMEVILSGRFEFQAIVNNQPITVQHGRFDVGIMKDNFYKF
jgi:hypothetical protein